MTTTKISAKIKNMKTPQKPSPQTPFKDLPIGGKFHTGKSRGMGVNSHVMSWEIWEKTSKSKGKVVDQRGNYFRSIGKKGSFSPFSIVFLNIA